jgi:hypothetical protein
MYNPPFVLAPKPGILLLLITLVACTETPCPPSTPLTTPLTVGGHSLNVEIAATVSARACGLSLREHLDENHGILFVYRDERTLVFWMKDTVIPLSIAFLDSDRRILGVKQMDPGQPERRFSSSSPARYALEVNQGWFRSHGIAVGDVVAFELPADLEVN